MAHLLITGGAGFIGSHTCVVLLESGHRLTVLDNFSNSSPLALERVAKLSNVSLGSKKLLIVKGDIRDDVLLDKLFKDSYSSQDPFDAVIHFAGLKAVSESVVDPLLYWKVNVGGSLCLLEAMNRYGCKNLVFSSSATLYGYPESLPISETAAIKPINPYGHSKATVEQILADVANSSPKQWRIASLRYFNPVGAHPSGNMGEDPRGIPNNLFPYINQVMVGARDQLKVFGGDWPTPDGSGIRDYIHVMDVAEGHRAALDCLLTEEPQVHTLNLGTGRVHQY